MLKVAMVFLFGVMLPASSRAFDVTACGQVVPARETGVLQTDLTTCSSSATGVFVEDRGELDLNGHVVASGAIGVSCEGKRCKVHGPGEVRNAVVYGIQASFPNARLTVQDVDVHDNGQIGIVATSGKPLIKLQRVQSTGNRSGVEVIFKGRIIGEDVDASNNSDIGIGAGARFRFERLTVLGTGAGDPGPYDVGVACSYGGGTLIDSVVTGSAAADLGTARRPRLVDSTCGTSIAINPPGPTWGVCAND